MKRITFISLLALTSISISTLQADSPIALSVGKTHEIKLESNKSTGYSWQASCTPENSVIISPSVYKAAESKGQVGVGGTETFTITAKQTGTATCTFKYSRPFEKNAEPAKTQTFTFTVTPKKSCCK